MIGGFQPRYFELRADNGESGAVLMYALPPAEGGKDDKFIVRGRINMADAQVAVEQGSSRNFTVTASSTGQLFARIRCGSERERAEWITALELAQRSRGRSVVDDAESMHSILHPSPSDDKLAVAASAPDHRLHERSSTATTVDDVERDGWTLLSKASSTGSCGSGDGGGYATAPVDITESECTSDDSVDELDGEHADALHRIFQVHSSLRKRCESLAVKLASVADDSESAALPTSTVTEFERTYCCLLGASSELVNDGICVSHWLSERLREAVLAQEEIDKHTATLARDRASFQDGTAVTGTSAAAGACR